MPKILLMALLVAMSPSVLSQPGRAAPVITVEMPFLSKSEQIEIVGTLEAKASVDVFALVSDRVSSIHFRPGDIVTGGQKLVELDHRREQVAVDLARLNRDEAKRSFDRLSAIHEQNALSEQDLESARYRLELAETRLREAEIELQDHIIRAPISGQVGLTDIRVGNRIDPNTFIVSIQDLSDLYLDIRVPESQARLVSLDSAVPLTTWANTNQFIEGTVTAIDVRIDADRRTLRVRIALPQDTQLKPGSSLRAVLRSDGADYPAVPESALMWGGDGAYVWVVDENRAKRVRVEIVQRQSGQVLVDGELSINDRLIVEGVQRLRDGQEVSEQRND